MAVPDTRPHKSRRKKKRPSNIKTNTCVVVRKSDKRDMLQEDFTGIS